jgi:hypothetical protein
MSRDPRVVRAHGRIFIVVVVVSLSLSLSAFAAVVDSKRVAGGSFPARDKVASAARYRSRIWRVKRDDRMLWGTV